MRRKPKSKRTAAELLATPTENARDHHPVFSDADLERLRLRGYFDTLIGQVKGGKEATVYLMGNGDERLVAKVYADLESRSFRNDANYWSGVHIGDKRIEKALKKRTRAGQAAQMGIWVLREYLNLWRLHDAGLPVPKPKVGPEVKECAAAGSVVLMEFIGHDDEPAPRLSDVKLVPDDAQSALDQSIKILLDLAKMGLVHGDFSTYNLLWHDGRVVLIDVPQILDARSAPKESRELLLRDVNSLLTSFKRHRVEFDAFALQRQAQAHLNDVTKGT